MEGPGGYDGEEDGPDNQTKRTGVLNLYLYTWFLSSIESFCFLACNI